MIINDTTAPLVHDTEGIMCEQPFEYGEKVIVWNDPNYKHTQRFLGISAKGDYLTIPEDEFHELSPSCRFFMNARRCLPDIKPGHPVMYYEPDTEKWHIGTVEKHSDYYMYIFENSGTGYCEWKPLPNYDYTQPPPIEI